MVDALVDHRLLSICIGVLEVNRINQEDKAMPSKRPSLDHSERSSSDPRESANRLFGSAAVVDLLIVLCADPGRRYYVNELIKVTGRYPRSVQLGLARLEAAGVIRGERVANATFYCLVTDHPFAEALVAIAARIPRPVDLLKQALLGLDDVDR